MAYFDSPKNKAIWEKELGYLKEEKQRRMSGGPANVKESEREVNTTQQSLSSSHRVRTSFAELLKEETLSVQKGRSGRSRAVSMQEKTNEKVQEAVL